MYTTDKGSVTFDNLEPNTDYYLVNKPQYDRLMRPDPAQPPLMVQPKPNHHAISNMERATKTYKTRNRVYGNNYKRFGVIMMSLFPEGVLLNTAHQWNRFGILIQKVSKLSRYVTDPMNGHMDSVHDDGVYSFMLEQLDAEQLGLSTDAPVPLVMTQGYLEREEVLPNPCEHVFKYPCRKLPQDKWCAIVPGQMHACGFMTCINCGEKYDSI